MKRGIKRKKLNRKDREKGKNWKANERMSVCVPACVCAFVRAVFLLCLCACVCIRNRLLLLLYVGLGAYMQAPDLCATQPKASMERFLVASMASSNVWQLRSSLFCLVGLRSSSNRTLGLCCSSQRSRENVKQNETMTMTTTST